MSQADQTVSTHRIKAYLASEISRCRSSFHAQSTRLLIAGESAVGREPGVVGSVTGAARADIAAGGEEQGNNARDSKVKVYLCRLYSFISSRNLDFILWSTHPRITHAFRNVLFSLCVTLVAQLARN